MPMSGGQTVISCDKRNRLAIFTFIAFAKALTISASESLLYGPKQTGANVRQCCRVCLSPAFQFRFCSIEQCVHTCRISPRQLHWSMCTTTEHRTCVFRRIHTSFNTLPLEDFQDWCSSEELSGWKVFTRTSSTKFH